jgi:L-serine deaminase
MAIALGALLLLGSYIHAEEGNAAKSQKPAKPDRAAMLDKIMAKLDEELVLDDEQEEELRRLYSQHFDNMKGLMERAKTESFRGKRKLKKEAKSLRKQHQKRIEAVLSEEQLPKFRELRDEIRAVMRETMKQHRQATDPS